MASFSWDLQHLDTKYPRYGIQPVHIHRAITCSYSNTVSNSVPFTIAVPFSHPTVGTTPAFTPTPPLLRVSLNVLVFYAPVEGPNPTPQLILIMNAGGGRLDWKATVVNGTPGILSIDQGSGSGLAGGATRSITVAVYTTQLAAGTYVSQVTISAVDHATGQPVAGSPSYVSIHITVLPSRPLQSPTPSLKLFPIPSPSPSPTLCLTPLPTPLPTPSPTPSPTPTPETGLGLVQK